MIYRKALLALSLQLRAQLAKEGLVRSIASFFWHELILANGEQNDKRVDRLNDDMANFYRYKIMVFDDGSAFNGDSDLAGEVTFTASGKAKELTEAARAA